MVVIVIVGIANCGRCCVCVAVAIDRCVGGVAGDIVGKPSLMFMVLVLLLLTLVVPLVLMLLLLIMLVVLL